MKRSSELRAQAWSALSGKWGMAVVAHTGVYGNMWCYKLNSVC